MSASVALGSKAFATKPSFKFGFCKEERELLFYSQKIVRINRQKLNLRKAARIYYTQKGKTTDYHSLNNIPPNPRDLELPTAPPSLWQCRGWNVARVSGAKLA